MRFHSKYHNKNHHSNTTSGFPDSASDPIASYNEPFQGDFYLNGILSAFSATFVNPISSLDVDTIVINNPISTLSVETLTLTSFALNTDGTNLINLNANELNGISSSGFVQTSQANAIDGYAKLNSNAKLEQIVIPDNISLSSLNFIAIEEYLLETDLSSTVTPLVTSDTISSLHVPEEFIPKVNTTTTLITSSPYNISIDDKILLVDDDTIGLSSVDLNLPSASVVGDGWPITIKKLGSTGELCIIPQGVETIDELSSLHIKLNKETESLISNGENFFVLYPHKATGWAQYADDTYTELSPLNVDNAKVQLTIEPLTSTPLTSFLPQGVSNFWDLTPLSSGGQKIMAHTVGDALDMRIDFKADPTTLNDYADIILDIGDGSPDNPIVTRTITFSKTGINSISVGFPVFTLDTFVTNGGKIYIDTSESGSNIDIYGAKIFIKRDHSPI